MFEQDRLLMRLQQRVYSEPSILVCFLSGSYGRRTQDGYSDLDIALVYSGDSERESAYLGRKEFAQSIMPYVPVKSFDASHVRRYFHIALYANGAKADFRYETTSSLEPSSWDRDINIIKDTDKWAEVFQQRASQLSPVPPQSSISNEELVEMDNRFWVMFMDIYRQLLRGDFDKPYPVYLELLSFTIPRLLSLLPVEDTSRRALLISHYDHDIKATIGHLRGLLGAYLDVRQAVISRYNLAFRPVAGFESAMQELFAREK